MSNCPVYRRRDILIGYLVWEVRSGAKHGQSAGLAGQCMGRVDVGN